MSTILNLPPRVALPELNRGFSDERLNRILLGGRVTLRVPPIEGFSVFTASCIPRPEMEYTEIYDGWISTIITGDTPDRDYGPQERSREATERFAGIGTRQRTTCEKVELSIHNQEPKY